jgi:hypothetical protein
MRTLLLLLAASCLTLQTFAQLTVNFTINTAADRAPISPLIYGTNQILQSTDNYKSLRMGGNRITGLNWENNASNAGSDYFHQSDSYLCRNLSSTDCGLPGKAYSGFYNQAKNNNIPYAITTLQMAGYVAADKNGVVSEGETAPSSRWRQVVFKKNAPFSLSPNTTDNYVYMDELVNYLKTSHGTTANGGFKGYFLDNEPALWPSTHARLHPAKPTAVELWTKSRDLAIAIKDVDSSAETFGGVFYGFAAFYNFQSAPDWNSEKGSYSWYIDYFLAKLKAASDANGKRLLDVLDFHWYPEAKGDVRITSNNANSANDRAARIQAPRSLWDPEYVENSWIASGFRSFLPLLPKMQNAVNTYNPGTKLSISEYSYGGCNDYSGGIAHADVLGIFGKYGIYNANYWNECGTNTAYVSAAFKIFNNYNGSGSTFGNTNVSAAMSDKVNSSVYASIDDNDENTLHIIAINKSAQTLNGTFNISSGATYTVGKAWGFDPTSATISARTAINSINGNSFTYALPPYSVYHIVLSGDGTPPPPPGTTVTVRARSINAGANMRVEVMDVANSTGGTVQQTKEFNNVATSFTDYTHSFLGTIPANRIRVRFTNDGGTPNRDLEVDYIRVEDVTHQTEDLKTFSSGCPASGYLKTQLLTCNGYFHYDIGTGIDPDPDPDPSPTSLTIYNDVLTSDWADWSWSVTRNFNNTSPVKVGAKSLSATYTAGWGGVSLRKGTAITTSGYSSIKFWVHGGSGSNKKISFTTQTTDGGGNSKAYIFTATAGVWNEFTVPLSLLGNPATIKRLNFQNNSSSAQSAIYFDDLRLVSASTTSSTAASVESPQEEIVLYPNPVTGNVLTLDTQVVSDTETEPEVSLSDTMGKECFRQKINSGQTNVTINPLPRGLYNVRVKVGKKVYKQRVFIEN